MQDGTYVIRRSTKQADRPYTLMIYLSGAVFNLPIRLRPDDNYALGSHKENEQVGNTINRREFPSIVGIILNRSEFPSIVGSILNRREF